MFRVTLALITVTNNLNYFVLMFYTYQLRIVHIKISTQDP